MTINGPAPVVLAFFMNAAIDQQVEKYLHENGELEKARQKLKKTYKKRNIPLPGRYFKGRSGTEYMYFFHQFCHAYDGRHTGIFYFQ